MGGHEGGQMEGYGWVGTKAAGRGVLMRWGRGLKKAAAVHQRRLFTEHTAVSLFCHRVVVVVVTSPFTLPLTARPILSPLLSAFPNGGKEAQRLLLLSFPQKAERLRLHCPLRAVEAERQGGKRDDSTLPPAAGVAGSGPFSSLRVSPVGWLWLEEDEAAQLVERAGRKAGRRVVSASSTCSCGGAQRARWRGVAAACRRRDDNERKNGVGGSEGDGPSEEVHLQRRCDAFRAAAKPPTDAFPSAVPAVAALLTAATFPFLLNALRAAEEGLFDTSPQTQPPCLSSEGGPTRVDCLPNHRSSLGALAFASNCLPLGCRLHAIRFENSRRPPHRHCHAPTAAGMLSPPLPPPLPWLHRRCPAATAAALLPPSLSDDRRGDAAVNGGGDDCPPFESLRCFGKEKTTKFQPSSVGSRKRFAPFFFAQRVVGELQRWACRRCLLFDAPQGRWQGRRHRRLFSPAIRFESG